MSEESHAAFRGQLPLAFGHAVSLAATDFIVGDGNRLAHAHISGHQNWPGPMTLIVGPAKSGKSHLARMFAERAGALTPAPADIGELSRAGGNTPVVLEDVDRLAYDESELFHLLNQSMRDERPVLMTARAPVSNWPYRTDDLLSRARLAAQFSVSAADDIMLTHMFAKLFADRQVQVEPRIIEYVVARMERSPEEVVMLVELMDSLALARGTAITRGVAAEALAARGVAQLELDLEGADDE